MSKAAGGLVFLAGIGGLGAWATVDHAKDIEMHVQSQATASGPSLGSGVATAVSGRDVVLTGQVGSQAEVTAAVTAAKEIEGVRDVRSALNLMPTVSPFVTTITKAADGTYAADGVVSASAVKDGLSAGAVQGLQVAAGAPEGYDAAFANGVAALDAMDSGTLRIEDGAVTLTGDATDAAGRDRIDAALSQIPADLTVSNDTQFVATADPFTFDVEKTADGRLVATGFLPSDANLEALANSMNADLSAVSLARGAPEGFVTSALAGVGALQSVQSGTLSMRGQDMSISGSAADDAASEAIAATDLPQGFALASDVSLTPSPDVFSVRAERSTQGEITASGFVSSQEQLDYLKEISGADLNDMVVANGAPYGWADAVRAGVMSLGELESGVLIMDGTTMSLRGSAPDEATFDQISTRLDNLQGDMTARTSIIFPVTEIFPPTIVPYTMTLNKDDSGSVVANGYAPSEAAIDQLGLDGLAVGVGAPDGWGTASESGLAALAELISGSVLMEGTTMRVTGTAPDRDTETAIAEILAGIDGFDVASEIAVPEVASDLALTARFEQNTGLTLEGIGPEGLTSVAAADFLGAPTVTGEVTATSEVDVSVVQAPLTALQPYIADLETVTVTWTGEQTAVTGVLIAQSDRDAILADLEGAGVFDRIDLTLAAQINAEGDTRVNPVTGINETFTNGVWSPQAAPEAVVLDFGECQAQTSAILAGNAVNFLTGGAELDATSQGVISDLADTVVACFEADRRLSILIEGHTDNTGSSVGNIRLSNARADAVRDALLANGVSAFRIQAIGFGQERPIADNNTQEGRAQNRRTVLVWNR